MAKKIQKNEILILFFGVINRFQKVINKMTFFWGFFGKKYTKIEI